MATLHSGRVKIKPLRPVRMSFFFRSTNSDVPSNEFEMRNRVRTPQFSLKVLSILHDLQAAPNTLCDGSVIKDIIKSMCENFNIDGDVKVQVVIALQQLVKQGELFV